MFSGWPKLSRTSASVDTPSSSRSMRLESQAASATRKVTLTGVLRPHSNPMPAAMSVSAGRFVASGKRAEAGSMLPVGRSWFTST